MGELNDMQWHGVDARRTNVEGISCKQVLISLSFPLSSLAVMQSMSMRISSGDWLQRPRNLGLLPLPIEDRLGDVRPHRPVL